MIYSLLFKVSDFGEIAKRQSNKKALKKYVFSVLFLYCALVDF